MDVIARLRSVPAFQPAAGGCWSLGQRPEYAVSASSRIPMLGPPCRLGTERYGRSRRRPRGLLAWDAQELACVSPVARTTTMSPSPITCGSPSVIGEDATQPEHCSLHASKRSAARPVGRRAFDEPGAITSASASISPMGISPSCDGRSPLSPGLWRSGPGRLRRWRRPPSPTHCARASPRPRRWSWPRTPR